MATLQVLLDDLNQRLGDANNAAGVGESVKIRWLANGVRAMWPKVFTVLVDGTTLAIVDGTYEYTLPSTFDGSEVYRIEVQVGSGFPRWARVDDYLIDGQASKKLVFSTLPGLVAAKLRIRAVTPLAEPTAFSSVIDYPTRYYELPVWYALGLAMQDGQENRLNYSRYSTTVDRNGVDVAELMNSAQFCFAQFELLLDRMAMPWPAG